MDRGFFISLHLFYCKILNLIIMNEVQAANMDAGQAPEIAMFGFQAEDTVKTIGLTDLEKSIRVEGKFGKLLQTRPIQSWELMTMIMTLFAEHNINYTQDVIYVQKKNSHIMINEIERQLKYSKESCPVNRWLFDKILTKWTVPFVGETLDKVGIAMGFNENGIELAFGTHVHVCSNFNILGGNVMRTYTHNGKPGDQFELIKMKLKEWMQGWTQLVHVETTVMNEMKNFVIKDREIILNTIGKLYVRAINQAYGTKNSAPFDTHGMSQIVQNYVNLKNPVIIENAWDLYNWGTNIMKPGTVDLAEINNNSEMFANFVLEDVMGTSRSELVVEAF